MPGENCCMPQCSTSRREKGVGIFQLPGRKDDFYAKWRNDILNIIKKYRVEDKHFKQLLDSKSVYICEKHFLPDEIELTSEYAIN